MITRTSTSNTPVISFNCLILDIVDQNVSETGILSIALELGTCDKAIDQTSGRTSKKTKRIQESTLHCSYIVICTLLNHNMFYRVEILEDCPEVDCVLVPVGGGGLMGGIARYIKQVRPSVEVRETFNSI